MKKRHAILTALALACLARVLVTPRFWGWHLLEHRYSTGQVSSGRAANPGQRDTVPEVGV
jgi:hypothetical protein